MTDQPEFALTPMRLHTIPACEFFHVGAETTHAEMHEAITALMPKLMAARAEGRVTQEGPVIFRYTWSGAMEPFTMEIGFGVPEGTPPAGEAQVKRLPELRCAALVLVGRIQNICHAYEALAAQMSEAGLASGEEYREVYAYFEGPESDNDVTVIQMAIRRDA